MADDAYTPNRKSNNEDRKPMNNGEHFDLCPEAAVSIRAPPSSGAKRRCPRMLTCSRIQTILLLVIAISFVTILSLVVVIFTRPPCHHPAPVSDRLGSNALSGNASVSSTTERDPGLVEERQRWTDIRLPRSIVPFFYRLTLRVDMDQFTFVGSVDIDVTAVDDADFVVLHMTSLAIDPNDVFIVHDQGSGDDERRESFRRVTVSPVHDLYILETRRMLGQGTEHRIVITRFSGIISEDLRGLYRSVYKDQNGRLKFLATSQLQSIDARRVFPCFDEPDLKARFAVSIIHQQGFKSLSNMPLVKTTQLEDGWVKEEFDETPVMSTYLLAFIVADFQHRETTTDEGLKIRIWARPDMYNQTEYALTFATKAYQFFSDYFGTPEVVSKADHAAIPDFSAGAMENWGLVLYRETALLHDDSISSISNKYWVSLVMAHEIAHTWFGNMVTMKWWDDLWLNEGFANTLMYFALDTIYPSWKVFDQQLVNNVYPVMTKDSLMTSHAISTPITHPDDITSFFDSISYDKGMAVLRLLRGFLGWEDFRRGLQRYITKFKFSNAEMSQLWQTFEEASNHTYRIGEIMDTWTRQMGFPVVSIKHLGHDRYRLVQNRFLVNNDDTFDPSSSPYGYKWKIPFSYRIEGHTETMVTWMDMDSAEIRIPPGLWMIGNVDYMGFYRTSYDDVMWRRLIAQLLADHKVFSASNRAGLINDAFNLARANLLSYEIAFNLTAYMHKEEDYLPWRAFIDAIDFIKGMLSTSDSYGALQKYIFDLVAPQYRRVGISDQGDLLDRNLRRSILEAASCVAVLDAIDWCKRTFQAWMTYGTKIPPDYAVVIYAVGIQEGGEREWDFLWQKSQSILIASESEIMMNALVYTQHPWLLWRYARFSLNSSLIRMQDVRNLFRYFSATPLGRSVALQFLLTNWDEINTRFGMDPFLLRDIIQAVTGFINTEYEYRQLARLYRDSPPAGVASKAAENSLSLVSSNINWMKTNYNTINDWLSVYAQKT